MQLRLERADFGGKHSIVECPVYRALRRRFRDSTTVVAGHASVSVVGGKGAGTYRYSEELRRVVAAYDTRKAKPEMAGTYTIQKVKRS